MESIGLRAASKPRQKWRGGDRALARAYAAALRLTRGVTTHSRARSRWLRSPAVLRGWIAIGGLAWAGCGAEVDPRPTTWGYIHAAIIAPNCATIGCHSYVSRQRDLSLERAESARAALLDRRDVVPGDESSPLMFQLRGQQRARMPPDAPLAAGDVDLIRRWIASGARP
jgi:hypothetical protein